MTGKNKKSHLAGVIPLRHRRVHFLTLEGEKEEEREQENEAPPSPAVVQQKQTESQNPPSNSNDVASPASKVNPSQGLQRQKSSYKNPGERPYFKVILVASFVLTINAAFINIITLNTVQAMASAHVTGLVARASYLAATGRMDLLYQYALTWASFVAGSCTSGVIVAQETFYLGRNYGRALFLIAAVEGIALLTEDSYPDSIFFIWLCAYACGLQNGLTSKFSGNAVRTTHLTGASTDLGIAMGHILKGRQGEWWKVKLHGVAVLGFFVGGILGFFTYRRFRHSALLFNIGITTTLAVAHTLYIAYHEGISPITVLESKTDIRMHKRRIEVVGDGKRQFSFYARPSPSGSALEALTPRMREKHLAAARPTSGKVVASPASTARQQKRHFPKNRAGEDADDHVALLISQETMNSSFSAEGGTDENNRAHAMESAASPPVASQDDVCVDIVAMGQLAPSSSYGKANGPAVDMQSVSSHLSHRSLQQYLDEEDLVPKPEDEGPLPEFAEDDFAALEAEASICGEIDEFKPVEGDHGLYGPEDVEVAMRAPSEAGPASPEIECHLADEGAMQRR